MTRAGLRVTSARDGFTKMTDAHEQVELHEATVEELRSDLKRAEERLKNARERFDDIRKLTLEHCPALETGYQGAALSETVGVVDGKVTVVPIGESGRPRIDRPRATYGGEVEAG